MWNYAQFDILGLRDSQRRYGRCSVIRCTLLGHRWAEKPGEMLSMLEDERGLLTVARMPSRVCKRCHKIEFPLGTANDEGRMSA